MADSRQSAAAVTRATGNALHRLAAALMARGGAGGGWEAATAVSAAQSVASQVLKNQSLRALLPPPALGALQALDAAAAVQSLLPHNAAAARHGRGGGGGSGGGGGNDGGGGGEGEGSGEGGEGEGSGEGDVLDGVFTIHDMQGRNTDHGIIILCKRVNSSNRTPISPFRPDQTRPRSTDTTY